MRFARRGHHSRGVDRPSRAINDRKVPRPLGLVKEIPDV
jgi:hypothetical protein